MFLLQFKDLTSLQCLFNLYTVLCSVKNSSGHVNSETRQVQTMVLDTIMTYTQPELTEGQSEEGLYTVHAWVPCQWEVFFKMYMGGLIITTVLVIIFYAFVWAYTIEGWAVEGWARPSFFWYEKDKDLKVSFRVSILWWYFAFSALNNSLWTMMMKEPLKYVSTAPYTFLGGLLLISELLPLPLPIPVREVYLTFPISVRDYIKSFV